MRAFRLLLPVFALLIASSTSFAQTLPTNPQPTCVASSQLFNSWFVSGSASLNGVVNPANSIAFQPANNCNFYLWSHQMLLWLLSPAPSGYGGSGRVFDSDVFYDVTTAVNNKRYFVPHFIFPPDATAADKARKMVDVRPAKPGPNGLPAVLDRQGNIVEVLSSAVGPNNRPLLLTQAGKLVEAARVTVGADKKAVFHDAAGNAIPQPKLNIPANLKGARVGIRFFTADNTPIIVGADGTVFDVSPAQAGGSGVLLAQNSSVVYYTILANDVYAFYASGVNSGAITGPPAYPTTGPGPLFPTTQAGLDQIQTYAGQTFPDGIALAVEVKLSWVDVSAVQNPGSYITSPAIVPTYDTSNPQKWVPGSPKFTTLALVGVHFVGSVNGHPEMVWSTFEHFGNTPVGPYQYVNTASQPVNVPANSAGTWLFSKSNSTGPFNVAHANYQTPPYIQGSNGFTVSPSDTQLVYPFGVAPTPADQPPNQEDATPAAANTEVLSSNNSVLGQLNTLAKGDVRANYYFVGSTWTFGGYAPTGQYNKTTNNGNGAEIGTNRLANSTMETYHQAGNGSTGSNCFGTCHTDASTGHKATTDVSHIFSEMAPLGSAMAVSPTDVPPPHVIPTATKKKN